MNKQLRTAIYLACFCASPVLNAGSLDISINSSKDDAEETISDKKMNIGSSDLELGKDRRKQQIVGMRFKNINIPKNSTITRAYIQFTVDEKSSQTTKLSIYGEKQLRAKSFSSRRKISSRTFTQSSVNWNPVAWTKVGEQGSKQRTPDISNIIQEIVDQDKWRKTIALFIKGSGKRVAESYDGKNSKAPVLHIEYKEPGNGGGNGIATLESGQDVSGSVQEEEYKLYKIAAQKDHEVKIEISHLSADADLYVNIGKEANKSNYTEKSTHGGTTKDNVAFTMTQNDDIYIAVYGFRAANYNVKATISGGNNNQQAVERTCNDNNIRQNNIKPCSVSTFHNISIYWSPKGGKKGKNVSVRYREAGSQKSWQDALKTENLTHYPITYGGDYYERPKEHPVVTVDNGELISKGDYRGSIVNLKPNTAYEIALTFNGKTEIIKASTWKESFNTKDISRKNLPSNPNSQYTVNKINGTASQYIVIDGEAIAGHGNKYTITGETKYNILIKDSSYLILRNFELKNAEIDAIHIEGNSHNIIIEHNNISNWGYLEGSYAHDGDAGIHAENNLYGSIFQYNKIHDPRYKSNTWGQDNEYNKPSSLYHPRGANAITLKYNKKGNNVIRYNEFYSNSRYFMDIVGGGKNDGAYGFLGPDSDIYGNYIANAYDDGIEMEGGGENVRIWHNFIEKTFLAIANAPVTVGPLYIWRNISGKAAEVEFPKDSIADENAFKPHGNFIKMGATRKSKPLMKGKVHIYNNTILNINDDGYGGLGTTLKPNKGPGGQPNKLIKNTIIKNNILSIRASDYNRGVRSISNNLDKENTVVIGHNLISPYIVKYSGSAILHSNMKGKFKITYTNDNAGIRGECINNIIPTRSPLPLLGAQAANEVRMKFGTHYKFTPPSNIVNCN